MYYAQMITTIFFTVSHDGFFSDTSFVNEFISTQNYLAICVAFKAFPCDF